MAQREPSHHLLTELDGHTVAGLPSPTEQQFAQRTSEGAQRLLSTAVNKKEPITPELFSQLAKKHGGLTTDLKDLHFLFICLVRYTGFMCIDELMQSHKQHVIISDHSMEIYLPGARTSTTRVPQCLSHTQTCQLAQLQLLSGTSKPWVILSLQTVGRYSGSFGQRKISAHAATRELAIQGFVNI